MADEQKTEEKTDIVETPVINPFDEKNWTDAPVIIEEKIEETKKEIVEEKKEEIKEEIIDADMYLKTTLGFDTWEAAKEEIESLRKLKETAQTKEEIKFANEQSQRLFEAIKDGKDDVVYEILDTKKKLSSVDKLSAADVLKLYIEQTNKHYKQADVADVFEEKYSYPEKPVQADVEDDDDFKARIGKWEEAKAKVDRRIERDAVTAKAELSKLNTELTLPDIKKDVDPKLTPEAQQKELERLEGIRTQYLKVLESDYSKFNGYEVKAKDGEVEIPVAYVVTDEQKSALKNELKDFDVDGFITDRWFNKDGSPNIMQLMEDVHLLRNKGDVFQKIANEAASKRLVQHLGDKSKIEVNGKTDKTFTPGGTKNDQQKMAEFFWNQI